MRLTNKLRSQILDAVMDHAFKARQEQLAKAEGALAVELYNLTYTKEEQAFMNKVGSTGFGTKSDIYVFTLDRARWLSFYGEAKFNMSHRKTAKPEGDLLQRIEAHVAALDSLRELCIKTHDEAEGILNSVTTVKRLLEVWPEVEAFVPKNPEQLNNLPAIPLAQLNSVLGLPPETKD